MKKMKILIIEDDIEMCDEIKAMLEDQNYSVCTASNGHEGSRRVKKDKYDLVLLDLKMPGSDGREVLKDIKTNQLHVKTIVMTGTPLSKRLLNEEGQEEAFPYEDDYEHTILRQANAIFNKPFDVMKLISKIDALVKNNEQNE